jgi:hypothetical protein
VKYLYLQVQVCGIRSVTKSDTVPVPVIPVLETPQVYPYPCGTLHMRQGRAHYSGRKGARYVTGQCGIIRLRLLVHGTGNPWVKSALPVSLPMKTCTRATGTGFFTGLYFRTLTQPVPVPVASNPQV